MRYIGFANGETKAFHTVYTIAQIFEITQEGIYLAIEKGDLPNSIELNGSWYVTTCDVFNALKDVYGYGGM